MPELFLMDADGFELAAVTEFLPVYSGQDGVIMFTVTAKAAEAPQIGSRLSVSNKSTGQSLARFICLRVLPWKYGTVRITGKPEE